MRKPPAANQQIHKGGESIQKKIALVITLLALTMLAAPAFAVDAETPPALPIEVINGIWAVAVATPLGFLVAFFTCLAGYASKTPPEQFKLDHFLYTAIISVSIGAIFMFSGLPQTSITIFVVTWFANGYITWYIWKATKIAAGIITNHFIPTPTGPPTT
jgi:hypothetical protein